MNYEIEGDLLAIRELLQGAMDLGIVSAWKVTGDVNVTAAVPVDKPLGKDDRVACVDCGHLFLEWGVYMIKPPGDKAAFAQCPECWERMVQLALKGHAATLSEKESTDPRRSAA